MDTTMGFINPEEIKLICTENVYFYSEECTYKRDPINWIQAHYPLQTLEHHTVY